MKTTSPEILSLLADAEVQLLDEIRQTLKDPRKLRVTFGRTVPLTKDDSGLLDRVVWYHVEELIFGDACFGDFYPGIAIRLSESLNAVIRQDINATGLTLLTEVSNISWESEIRDSIESFTNQPIEEHIYKSACINSLYLKRVLIERLLATLDAEIPESN